MKHVSPDWDTLIQDCVLHPRDDARLTRFFQALSPYLRALLVAMYSHDISIVDDALQSAFVKIIRILREGSKSTLRIGYFVVIAKNCLIDELRKRKGFVGLDEFAETELAGLPPTLVTGQQEERMLLLQLAILQLEPRCRFILESYYINEIDARKLATWLGISADSVHMAIKRCRDRLREILAPAANSTAPVPSSTKTQNQGNRGH